MSKTEKAKVYFTDFHTIAFGDGLPAKLKKLIRKAGIGSIDMDGKFVAIKMHFGELGNISYLRPNYAKAVVDAIRCIQAAARMRLSTWNAPGKTDLPR